MIPQRAKDGTITFPKRGLPPPLEEGYERDPGDPWRLLPLLPECPLRTRAEIELPCVKCQKKVTVIECQVKPEVTYYDCEECIRSGIQIQRIRQHLPDHPFLLRLPQCT